MSVLTPNQLFTTYEVTKFSDRPATERHTIREALTKIRSHGLQNLVAIPPQGGSPVGETFELPAQLDEAAAWASERNADGMNVYFTVNPVKAAVAKKPTKADIAAAEYAHVDIDPDISEGYEAGRTRLFGQVLPELEAFDPRPNLIVNSGNGLQTFWRLSDASIEAAEEINGRLIARFGGDVGTGNIDRLMRLPGTLNYPSPKKLEKGYPKVPGQAMLVNACEGSVRTEALGRVLPEVERGPTSHTSGKALREQDFDEDTTPLTDDEIEALDETLDQLLDKSPALRRRWHGEADGLRDDSRSGFDFAVTALLKANGLSYREVAHLLRHEFKHGKRANNTDRDLQRNWKRVSTSSPDEIAAACVDAHAQDGEWEAALYAARPNRQTVEAVLAQLASRAGFQGKRALKADYELYAANAAAEEHQAAIAAAAGTRLSLLWDPTRLNDMVNQVEAALTAYPGEWEVLLHGGVHCRIGTKPPEQLHRIGDSKASPPSTPTIERYDTHGMLLRIEQSVAFYVSDGGKAKTIPVPERLPNLVLSKPDPKVPVTVGLVSHPIVLPNGEVLLSEGLNTESGIYAKFGGTQFVAPGSMTAQEGVEILRTEMLGEFDFASPVDEAAALALILTAIQRKTLDMSPGFMINASTQGSGKTTLARMTHLLITGHDMPVAAMSEDVAEQDKALTAMLMASAPIVCFDNVPDAFTVKSPVLARALTSPTHTGRILGLSKMTELPTNTLFVVTGNNITADIDLSRRLLEVRLATKNARPEQRRFNHPDVTSHVLTNRIRWVQAALAVLKERDSPDADIRSSGFHQWDKAVRWPLLNAGVADPVVKFDEVREKSPEHERQHAWMLGLAHGFGVDNMFRAQDLKVDNFASPAVVAAFQGRDKERFPEMFKDYLSDHPPAGGWDNIRSIGWVLSGLVGRIIEEYTLNTKKVRGTTHYVVERVTPDSDA